MTVEGDKELDTECPYLYKFPSEDKKLAKYSGPFSFMNFYSLILYIYD